MSDENDVVYFFDWRSDGRYIRIGYTSEWHRRKATHIGDGQTLIAVMRGTLTYEERLHRHFAPSRLALAGQKSVYNADAVFPYVEGLIRAGHACVDDTELEHAPMLPWEAIDPARTGGAAKQLQLLAFGDRRLSLAERGQRAAKFACYSSKTDEWYTPSDVVEAARATMGAIDLDPASCPVANRTVRAAAYYSERQSGLDESHPWQGRVWMNPPYGGLADLFVSRLMREVEAGAVSQAIVLLSSQAIVTKWADSAIRQASAIGISRGRWAFDPGAGQAISSPAGGSSLLYFGPRVDAFSRYFDALAHVFRPCWRRPEPGAQDYVANAVSGTAAVLSALDRCEP